MERLPGYTYRYITLYWIALDDRWTGSLIQILFRTLILLLYTHTMCVRSCAATSVRHRSFAGRRAVYRHRRRQYTKTGRVQQVQLKASSLAPSIYISKRAWNSPACDVYKVPAHYVYIYNIRTYIICIVIRVVPGEIAARHSILLHLVLNLSRSEIRKNNTNYCYHIAIP